MGDKRSLGRSVYAARVAEDLRRHVGDASRRLRGSGPMSNEQIHNTRRDLKRSRASLRLLRPIIGKRTYMRENEALRDAARPLSAARDAKVIMDTLDGLLESGATPAQRKVLQTLHTRLENAQHAVRETLFADDTLGGSADALERVWARVDRWRIARKGAPRVLAGLEHVYRRGRDAFAKAEEDPSAENLHEWRKQVKYLGNAMEVLSQDNGCAFAKPVKRAASLASALGDDHDLVVLNEKIADVHAGSQNAHRALSSRITQRRAQLEAKALRKGRKLYKLKAKAFVKRLQRDSRFSTSIAPASARS
ncbi:MAG: domain containing protein [Betaproteobacteria bacterium]|nr:domain containing protein [Betaproteobacteria bacterium]